MSDHTKAPGFPLLHKMIKSRKVDKVRAFWISAESNDQINLRACIATFRDEKKALDLKKREFDTVETVINTIEKTINSIKVESRKSSGESQESQNELLKQPAKKAKTAKTVDKPVSSSSSSGGSILGFFGGGSSSSSDV